MIKKNLGENYFFSKFRRPFNSKKGLLFIVDVLLGFSIIVIGFLILTNYYYSIPVATQTELYSDDFLYFLTTTEYGEFTSNLTVGWLSADPPVVTEGETIGSSFARFCNQSDDLKMERLLNETLDLAIPLQLNFEINVYDFNDTKLGCSYQKLKSNSGEYSRLSSSRTLILSRDDDFELIGPYTLEVRVW